MENNGFWKFFLMVTLVIIIWKAVKWAFYGLITLAVGFTLAVQKEASNGLQHH